MNQTPDKNDVNYGFVKFSKEQAIYTIVMLGLIIISFLPPVRSINILHITLCQWILVPASLAMPIISIARMVAGKKY